MNIHRPASIPQVKAESIGEDLQHVFQLAEQHRTCAMRALSTGLFPAANVAGSNREYTNYDLVWVRDNIHVAHQFFVIGDVQTAVKTVVALTEYFTKYQHRFVDIIEGRADASLESSRPQIRFDGKNLSELASSTYWNHKQNDALGYYVWLFSKLALSGSFSPTQEQIETLALFPKFLAKIEYWHDEDNGHWEEWPKVEASSIGVVVAGLRMLQTLADEPGMRKRLAEQGIEVGYLEVLIDHGDRALSEILPYECIQQQNRRDFDAALLFLIYPLEVVDEKTADSILNNVITQLQGNIGIARYPHDSFWGPDYKSNFSESERTASVTADDDRQKSIVKRGEEAQWCIFDPIISCIFGNRYQLSNSEDDLQRQIFYLNRSLRQLTPDHHPLGSYQCPEAYYLENGVWVANDSTPLLWSQANLRLALHFANCSAEKFTH